MYWLNDILLDSTLKPLNSLYFGPASSRLLATDRQEICYKHMILVYKLAGLLNLLSDYNQQSGSFSLEEA